MTDKATEMVDQALKVMSGRELVSAQEITDLLLDIRLYLIGEQARQPIVVTHTEPTSHSGKDRA